MYTAIKHPVPDRVKSSFVIFDIRECPDVKITNDCLTRSAAGCFIGWLGGTTGSASDQQSTNDRKVAGSRPTKVVCITVFTGNRTEVNCPLWPAATPSSEL